MIEVIDQFNQDKTMESFNYHQTPEGIHVIDSKETKSGLIAVEDIIEILQGIQYNAFGKPVYVVLNLEAHYHLPVREFAEELRPVYQSVDGSKLKLALVVQPSMVNVLEVVVKTLVSRQHIHYFTMSARAYLWLNLERKRAGG